MDQTSVIAGSLILAYIVFITVRGELTGYLQDLGIVSGETAPASQPYTTTSQTYTQGPSITGGSSGGSVGGGGGGANQSGVPSGNTGGVGGQPAPIPSGGGSSGGIPPNTVPGATTVVCPPGYTTDATGNCVNSSVSGYGGGACNGFIDPNTGICVENPGETNPPPGGMTIGPAGPYPGTSPGTSTPPDNNNPIPPGSGYNPLPALPSPWDPTDPNGGIAPSGGGYPSGEGPGGAGAPATGGGYPGEITPGPGYPGETGDG